MNRSCVGYRRSRPRHHDTVRLGRDGHRQQLVLRLLANTEGSLAILVSPLEHLVCIYSMLTGHSGNRSSRNKRRFYDATLLLPCSSLPLMRRGRFLNCFRIAHKVSVRQKNPDVYTAKSGRLLINASPLPPWAGDNCRRCNFQAVRVITSPGRRVLTGKLYIC
jgi:hypothetical protein